jgi:hypothetical protein
MQAVNDFGGGEIGLGQLFETLTQLRVVTQLSPFGDRASDLSLTQISARPFNCHLYLFRIAHPGHEDLVNHLSNHVFALSHSGRGRGPDQGQAVCQLLNLLFFLGREAFRLVMTKPLVVVLQRVLRL